MNNSVNCHGCGQKITIPADFTRSKMRCPQCGVMCAVPTSAPKQQPSAPSPPKQQPIAPRAPASKRSATAPEETVDTANERRVRAPAESLDPEIEEVLFAPEPPPPPPPAGHAKAAAQKPAPPASPAKTRPASDDDEDNSDPYAVTGEEERLCPGCYKLLPKDALLCAACGLNLETGEQSVKTYNPLVRQWASGITLFGRILLFFACDICMLMLGLIALRNSEDPTTFIGPWLLFTLMLALVLGTFDRLDLARSSRGKVVFTRTWRIFFIPLSAKAIRLRDFDGISTGCDRVTSSFFDWICMLSLLFLGIVPGLLWWYFIIHKDTFYVVLTRDQGRRMLTLYRGWNEAYMQDIAETLRDVGYLRHVDH